ncbi:hypothetical protein [Cupriavidus sp. 2SB]|nr:hypothetical protein [Cupriavidus sp. 2SB]
MKFLRALAFWFGTAIGVIALSALYASLNTDAATATPIWRQQA